eukprot:CAMPEP_0172306588 /NCGR_PEP_ID=MMETSP1058-20130122/7637_1 /TAXON_ID=83371 /ORGANISM="Detonula confervacea, Strain CCMP 353" /LENGTH=224 /DNA_ID=CAMNT_0013018525 /DNA_START=7 /DNA_END=681 /DNA_ORIENTATION=+
MSRSKGTATLCRALTGVFIITAIVFSSLTITSCEFVKRGAAIFGLFNYGVEDDTCVGNYEDSFTHGWLHTWAAVCGALAPFLGAIVVIVIVLDCFCKVCCSSAIKSIVLSGAELSQALTFLMYASDACISTSENGRFEGVVWGGCYIGQGSIYSCVAFGCYFIAGCTLCFGPKHDPLFCQNDDTNAEKPHVQEEQPEQVVVQDEENAAAADQQSLPEEVRPQVY